MTAQADFWKSKPYDFEAIVAGADLSRVSETHRFLAAAHARFPEKLCSGRPCTSADWAFLERRHDICDRAYFGASRTGSAAHDEEFPR